jgi:chromate reductase
MRANRVLGLAGSLRRQSWNRRLLAAAARTAPDDFTVTVFDTLDAVPLFNEDRELPTPSGVRDLRDAVRAADGLLIATPEYNQSMPGVLKNAIDWLSRDDSLLRGKPVAIVGVTTGNWGTRLAQATLRQALTATGASVMPQPSLFVTRADERFDGDGHLSDGAVAAGLAEVVKSFRRWIAINAAEQFPRHQRGETSYAPSTLSSTGTFPRVACE